MIGVVHLLPLPGSARWHGPLDDVIERAVKDAVAYQRGGADAIEIENFGDLPFGKEGAGPEVVAAMAVVGATVRTRIRLPIGFNVLRNDALASLALCAACGGSFIRVNVLIGAMVTDQGIIEGRAREVSRYRQAICPQVAILADVLVKHAAPLGDWPIEAAARDTLERGLADGLIVSGPGTGQPTDPKRLERVRKACPEARLFVGSGVTATNAGQLLPFADGFIVGTSLKHGGKAANPVDPRRAAALRRVMDR